MRKIKYKILIKNDRPSDTDEWNMLAQHNSNLPQSTYYDQIESFYGKVPIYIEARDNEELIGGVKLYLWKSKKIAGFTEALSKSLNQDGEFLVKRIHETQENISLLKQNFRTAILNYIKANKIVSFTINGIYGSENLLIDFDGLKPQKTSIFNIAKLSLNKPEENLWQNIHTKHKYEIRKAINNNLIFCKEDNIKQFIELIKETYAIQNISYLNYDYILHIYTTLKKHDMVDLFFAKNSGGYLASAFNSKFGNTVYYSFAGTKKNNLGAGHFLHWQIIKHYKKEGINNYILGQVARERDPSNLKFSEGITRFKNRFGTTNSNCFSKKYVFNTFKYKAWKFLVKLTMKK